MILIRHIATSELLVVNSVDGYPAEAWAVVRTDAVDLNGTAKRYRSDGTLEDRPPQEPERTRADLNADPRWTALRNATGTEIDAWLTNNVTSLAQARQVLGLLLRAIRVLAADRRFD